MADQVHPAVLQADDNCQAPTLPRQMATHAVSLLAGVTLATVIIMDGAVIAVAQTAEAPVGNAATSMQLPAVLDRFVAAVNGGDTAAFLDFFPENGVVDDWGRRFIGPAAISGWSHKEFIGAKGILTVKSVRQTGNEVDVRAGWKSSFHSGDSRFVFVLDGDKIREMRITSDK